MPAACSISSMFFNRSAKSSSLEKFEYILMCCWCRKFLWVSMEMFWVVEEDEGVGKIKHIYLNDI